MNDNQQENSQPENNQGYDDSSPVSSETIGSPSGAREEASRKQSASQNIKKTFGSGPGLIAAIIGGLALILFIALGIRGMGQEDSKAGIVQQPNTPDARLNQAVSPEEAERRRQVAILEAQNAANGGKSYQAPFDLNIQTAQNGYSGEAGQFNLSPDVSPTSASQPTSNPNPNAQNQQQQAALQEQQQREAAAAAAYQAQQQAYKDAIAIRDEDITNRKSMLNSQIDGLYKNILPNGRHTTSVYYSQPKNDKSSNTSNPNNPNTNNPGTSNPQNPGTDPNAATAQQGPPYIKAGTIMYAQLDAEVDTDDGGPVMATIYGGPLAGAKLLGAVQKGNDNIRLAFRTVSPNDSRKGTFAIDAVALRTEDAKQGLATSINRHTITRYSSLLFSSALAGVGDAFSNRQYGTVTQLQNGTTVVAQDKVNDREIIGNAVGRVGQNLSGEIMQRGFNKPTTYKVARGTGVAVYFMTDIYLNNQ